MTDKGIESKLKVLEAKKETLFQRIQRLLDYTKDMTNRSNVGNLRLYCSSLDNTRDDFSRTIDEINFLSSKLDPDYEPNFQVLDVIDQMCCRIKQAAEVFLNISPPTPPKDQSVNKDQHFSAIPRLPKIELVEFSGNPLQWPVFYETFKSLVHENKELDDSCKIYYLLSKLKGRALTLCSGVAPVAANYAVIWDILLDRYQDSRSLAVNYLRQILEFKPAQCESQEYLNTFLERFDTSVSALKGLKLTDLSDFLLYYVAFSKLDNQTQRLFEMKLAKSEMPTYSQLVEFLKQHAKVLAHTSKGSLNSAKLTHSVNSKQKVPRAFVSTDMKSNISSSCSVCRENHYIYNCSKFLQLSPKDRYNLVKEKFLCLNCLSSSHRIAACRSLNRCSLCKNKHHSLLHFPKDKEISNTNSPDSVVENRGEKLSTGKNEESVEALNFCSTSLSKLSQQSFTTLLSTAIVHVIMPTGDYKPIRVLLDSGSQKNFLTYKCCQRLNLSVNKIYSSVVGIGCRKNVVKGQVKDLVISSRFSSNLRFCTDSLVVNKITDRLPSVMVETEKMTHLFGLPLADPDFHKPGEIDGIIGAELFSQVIGREKVAGPPDTPVALQSRLGYLVMGKVPIFSKIENTSHSFFSLVDLSLEERVQHFFDLEEIPREKVSSPDDIQCENHFLSTHIRSSDGRYVVALPFKNDPSTLGDSYSLSLHRFLRLEKQFVSSPTLHRQYSSVVQDYLDQGHMHRLEYDHSKIPAYYIPHHAIMKSSSSSTPLRVVFDASAKTSTGLSLNDILHTGPKLQTDILSMFLNFRLYPIAFTADIRQMYRQINLCKEHQQYQRILWRFSPADPIETYELTTVAFGVKPSPFLALRTIRQLASDEASIYPEASQVILRDMYVDDLTSSSSNIDCARFLYQQLIELLQCGGFKLVKWSSNSKELLDCIPEAEKSSQAVSFDSEALKILGIQWQSCSDVFSFKICIQDSKCTKRNILSTVASLFDPCGYVSVVVVYAKLFIRKLWLLRLGWDETPPDDMVEQWSCFKRELPLLENFSIPRHLGITECSDTVLVGFADASESAYGAVVYVRTSTTHGGISVNLVCSKSKVSPLQVQSIPRLELCAALLLAKLIHFVIDTYRGRYKFSRIFACTDSTIVLGWICSAPYRWKTFVANRVAKIHGYLPQHLWYHVSGKDNPADYVSRGMTPSVFLKHSDGWLSGPSWLVLEQSLWPIKNLSSVDCSTPLPEEKVISLPSVLNIDNPLFDLISRSSSWSKLLRTVVFVLRFIKKLPLKEDISFKDLDAAERVLLRIVQGHHFTDDIRALNKGKECSAQLRKLRPFMDEGLMRVGGRLSNSSLAYDHKYPILLPKKDHFVDLLIDHYHRLHLHTGAYLVVTIIRQKYWILSARRVVRQRIQACNYCFRFKPTPTFPMMAELPPERVVSQVKAFIATGLDFAGPYLITLGRHRGAKSQKAYVCLFVCLATKALHLELVSDLSTSAFMNALKRFLSRRGPVKSLHSDRGTNFVGAAAKLDEIYAFIESSDYTTAFKEELTKHRIEWHFIPPAAPHMGGIWESNIKSMKTHLNRLLGNQLLSFEEFQTVLAQIEALLNSRPLCWLNSDPSDPEPLTPAHFLTLTSLKSLPANDVSSEPLNRLDRKQLLDSLVQSYWRRWSSEYLSSLQVRQKWNTSTFPVKLGTVVVVILENIPPFQWPLGLITELFPGKDGIIRVVTVKMKDGFYKRPVVKLCPLPTQ